MLAVQIPAPNPEPFGEVTTGAIRPEAIREQLQGQPYRFSKLDRASLANIAPGANVLWFHLVSVYVVTYIVMRTLLHYSKQAVVLRVSYLASAPTGGPSHTVLLRDIPGIPYGTVIETVHRFLDLYVLAWLPAKVKSRILAAWSLGAHRFSKQLPKAHRFARNLAHRVGMFPGTGPSFRKLGKFFALTRSMTTQPTGTPASMPGDYYAAPDSSVALSSSQLQGSTAITEPDRQSSAPIEAATRKLDSLDHHAAPQRSSSDSAGPEQQNASISQQLQPANTGLEEQNGSHIIEPAAHGTARPSASSSDTGGAGPGHTFQLHHRGPSSRKQVAPQVQNQGSLSAFHSPSFQVQLARTLDSANEHQQGGPSETTPLLLEGPWERAERMLAEEDSVPDMIMNLYGEVYGRDQVIFTAMHTSIDCRRSYLLAAYCQVLRA